MSALPALTTRQPFEAAVPSPSDDTVTTPAYVEGMAETRYFIWEGPPDQLVKIERGIGYVLRGGVWQESEHAYRRVQGLGGDADSRPMSRTEAELFARGLGAKL